MQSKRIKLVLPNEIALTGFSISYEHEEPIMMVCLNIFPCNCLLTTTLKTFQMLVKDPDDSRPSDTRPSSIAPDVVIKKEEESVRTIAILVIIHLFTYL